MSIIYLLPTSAPTTVRPYDLSLDTERKHLVIGLLSNGFPDTENFLARQAEALAELLPSARFRIETKGASDKLSAVINDDLLADLSGECDAMLIAWGHCGSCTSGVTRDAIAFTDKHIPSVTLICDVFWDYSIWMARALGMPDIPRVRVPYPVAGTGRENQSRVARAAAPEILRAWRRAR